MEEEREKVLLLAVEDYEDEESTQTLVRLCAVNDSVYDQLKTNGGSPPPDDEDSSPYAAVSRKRTRHGLVSSRKPSTPLVVVPNLNVPPYYHPLTSAASGYKLGIICSSLLVIAGGLDLDPWEIPSKTNRFAYVDIGGVEWIHTHMSHPRVNPNLVVVDGLLYVLGGDGGDRRTDWRTWPHPDVFDPNTNRLYPLPANQVESNLTSLHPDFYRFPHVAASLANKYIFIFAIPPPHHSPAAPSLVLAYDIGAASWSFSPNGPDFSPYIHLTSNNTNLVTVDDTLYCFCSLSLQLHAYKISSVSGASISHRHYVSHPVSVGLQEHSGFQTYLHHLHGKRFYLVWCNGHRSGDYETVHIHELYITKTMDACGRSYLSVLNISSHAYSLRYPMLLFQVLMM